MGVDEFDVGVEVGEVGGVNGAVFEDPVVDKGAAVSGGGDEVKEGEAVDVEAGERHGVDFVDGGDEFGFDEFDVDETSAAVGGEIFGGDFHFLADIAEEFEFNFEEFYGDALDFDFGFRDDASGDEADGFDGVFTGVIFDFFSDFATTVDFQVGGADTFDFYAELLKVETDVLNHVVGAGADDGGGAREESGGHDSVFGDGVASFDEDDFFISFIGGEDFGFVETRITDGVDFEAESFEGVKVGFDGARAKRAAAGVRKAEFFEFVEERA